MRWVAIPYGSDVLCPVWVLGAWLSAAGICDGPMFQAADRHQNVSPAGLTPDAVARIIKARAATAGLDPQRYSGHSVRADLVTNAAVVGVPSWKIKEQTGGAPDAMLQHYIRDGELFVDNAVGAPL